MGEEKNKLSDARFRYNAVKGLLRGQNDWLHAHFHILQAHTKQAVHYESSELCIWVESDIMVPVTSWRQWRHSSSDVVITIGCCLGTNVAYWRSEYRSARQEGVVTHSQTKRCHARTKNTSLSQGRRDWGTWSRKIRHCHPGKVLGHPWFYDKSLAVRR